MKRIRMIVFTILCTVMFSLQSCGPVIFSTRTGSPPPPWFYPNRIETVRYIYFPDYTVYFDLTLGNYIYLDSGNWVTVKVLPPRFNNYNLSRSRQIRIQNYQGDDIRRYHSENRTGYRRTRDSDSGYRR